MTQILLFFSFASFTTRFLRYVLWTVLTYVQNVPDILVNQQLPRGQKSVPTLPLLPKLFYLRRDIFFLLFNFNFPDGLPLSSERLADFGLSEALEFFSFPSAAIFNC